jgi:murein L,D-transpeptidase YafK
MMQALRRSGLFGVALVALGLLGVAATATRSASLDEWATDLERGSNRLLWKWGLTLPGTPQLGKLGDRLKAAGLKLGAPVLVRIFKRESDLELWMQKDGAFVRFATYPVCRWAGELGTKQKLGDKQVPEGFYTVGAGQLNPNSRWFRSFNVGYPNRLDRTHGRTGDFIMVHGGCSSVGCVAVTNEAMGEIWQLVGAALDQGQPRFAVHIFPFRMTSANIDRYAGSASAAEWRDLEPGYRLFEERKTPPVPLFCRGRYNFKPGTEGSDGSQELRAGCEATAGL